MGSLRHVSGRVVLSLTVVVVALLSLRVGGEAAYSRRDSAVDSEEAQDFCLVASSDLASLAARSPCFGYYKSSCLSLSYYREGSQAKNLSLTQMLRYTGCETSWQCDWSGVLVSCSYISIWVYIVG